LVRAGYVGAPNFPPVIFGAFSLADQGQKSVPIHPLSKADAIKIVMRLPEVKEARYYMLRHGKDRRKMFPMTYGEPDRQHPYYW
jgi:hypothetical protein